MEVEAWSVVDELARNFNRGIAAEKGAPRIGEVTKRARSVWSKTAELHDLLMSLDAATLFLIRDGGSDFGILQDAVRFKHGPTVEQVVETLQGFSLSLAVHISSFTNRFPRDPGGNTNFYKRTVGSAPLRLVQESIFVFDHFRPNEAKGTEGGIFHQFTMAIFEYATGLDPESHSKLLPHLKDVAKAFRLRRAAEAEERTLFAQQKRLRRRPEENAAKIRELEAKIRLARRRKRKHWVEIFPQRKWK